MCIKYIYCNNYNANKNGKYNKINPLIKSALYDYISSDFLITFIFCIVLFVIFVFNIINDTNQIDELKNNSNIHIVITLVFSIGFAGIIGSIPTINWKIQSIVSINSFKYHFKRTTLVLCGFYGWLILLFVVFGSFINIILTVKYLYCLLIILFTLVNISLTITNMLMKVFIGTIFIILTIWISMLPIGFLPFLIIPIILTLIKAKNEYREWFLI
jgi:hypothetical protein